jgi:hypothetical protein
MDIAGAIETWRRVLTQPGEPTFEQEKLNPNGTLQTALIWMVIAGVVAAIFGYFAGLIGASSTAAMISQMGLPPEVQAQMGPMISMATAAIGGAGLGAIIAVPVGFLIGTFIMHLIARMLGGQGDYGKFAYLVSTYQAPLTMASSILSIIPVLGGCIGALLGIYGYVESYFAIKTNYGLSSGKAVIAILIPLILLFLLIACVAFVVIGMISAISNN